VFDIVAGLVATALGYALGRLAARGRVRRPGPARVLRPAFAEA
jgi:hypothetical protein